MAKAQTDWADLVSSRLALNYGGNIKPVFSKICIGTLRPGGRSGTSVERLSLHRSTGLAESRRTTWLVDNYFKSNYLWPDRGNHEVSTTTLRRMYDLAVRNAGFGFRALYGMRPQRQLFGVRENERHTRSLFSIYRCVS